MNWPIKIAIIPNPDTTGLGAYVKPKPIDNPKLANIAEQYSYKQIDYASLELPEWLIQQFEAWIAQYPTDKAIHFENFSYENYNELGRSLAREIKKLAGSDVQVFYVPEEPTYDLGIPELIE